MHLAKPTLKEEIAKNNLITGYSDLEKQLTANGIDLRLAAVIEIIDGGKLAINKADNKNPKLGKAYVLKGYENRLKEYDITTLEVMDKGTITLQKHTPYFVLTCEEVNNPRHLMIHIAARTSLFRLTQSALLSTFGEAGYHGFLCFMLLPFLNSEIELGARFAQLCFSELRGEAHYDEQHETNQQGGKLF